MSIGKVNTENLKRKNALKLLENWIVELEKYNKVMGLSKDDVQK
jgi:hypothetical protein